MMRYKLEVEIQPKFQILGFDKTNEYCNDLIKVTPTYESYIFFGTTKAACLNKLKRHYLKEIKEKEKELEKDKRNYNKIEEMIKAEER